MQRLRGCRALQLCKVSARADAPRVVKTAKRERSGLKGTHNCMCRTLHSTAGPDADDTGCCCGLAVALSGPRARAGELGANAAAVERLGDWAQ